MSFAQTWSSSTFHRPRRRPARFLGRPIPATESLETRSLLPLFVVNTLTDSLNDSLGVSNGQLSLREAVHASNTNAAFGDAAAGSPDGDTIVFSDSLRGETVQVQQGEFVLSDDIRIIGSTVGAGLSPGLTLSAGGLSRLFEIKTPGAAGSRADVQISNLILSDGRATAAVGGNGGAVLIQSNEDVTFRNVTVRDSIAAGNGGGISVGRGRSLVINGGSLLDNVAGRNGGGLWKNYARLTILDGVNDVTIDGNLARGSAADAGGGGIYSSGCLVNILDISDNIVTISNNRATGTSGSGGGIFSGDGRLTIEEATIRTNSANRAGGGIEVVNGFVGLNNVNLIGNDVNGTAGAPKPGNGGGLHVSGIANVTIDSGSVFGNSAATEGGGLWNQAGSRLTIRNGTLIQSNEAFGNAAHDGGGGIFNNGGVVVVNGTTSTVQIVGNAARGTLGSGGGIFSNGGIVTILSTSLTDNEAERAGGAIEIAASTAGARLRISDSTVATNSALGTASAPGNGGGIHLSGAAITVLVNSTLSGNRAAQDGGGIWSQLTGSARLTVTNSTITLNNAQRSGGGIWTNASTAQVGSAAVLSNTIVAQNTANMSAPDIRRFGRLFAFNSLVGNGVLSGLAGGANGNLIGSNTCVINAKLGTLSDNGGPTATHALLAGSPAINRGKNSRAINIAGDPLTTDQRGDGFARIRGGIVDIGATEATPMTGCATTRVVRTT